MCCSACSIGLRCQQPQEGGRDSKSRTTAVEESDNESERVTTGKMLVAERACSSNKVVLQAPLMQVIGNDSQVVVNIPFFKRNAAAGSYQHVWVANAFEMMIKTQEPDWKDFEVIMQVLFDSTER